MSRPRTGILAVAPDDGEEADASNENGGAADRERQPGLGCMIYSETEVGKSVGPPIKEEITSNKFSTNGRQIRDPELELEPPEATTKNARIGATYS